VDQHGVPNFARETARCIVELAKASATGTVHITNQGVTSWYEFCRELLRVAGHEEIRVEPISMAQTSRVAKRPNYSALSDKSLRAYGILMPHWRESLPVYLSDRAEVNRLNRSA
jgi:dTDP-4-dehydrorhamnose reductase